MKKIYIFNIRLMSAFAFSCVQLLYSQAKVQEADVVIYGGTSAAITAAIQVKRLGRSVLVVSPDQRVGGMTSNGLGWINTGKKELIGGIAREFYHRIWRHYQSPDAWKWENFEEFGNWGQGTQAVDGDRRTMWVFEPKVARADREVWLMQRKETKVGRGLGKTTGWTHRLTLGRRGVNMLNWSNISVSTIQACMCWYRASPGHSR